MGQSEALSFTLAGRRFVLSDDDVRARLTQRRPDPIRQYWVEVDGVRWPVKQVMALATGLGKGDFQSHNSRRLLAKLGFPVGAETRKAAASKGATRLQRAQGGTAPAQQVIVMLNDKARATAPAQLLASTAKELASPGVYSWWVDEVGAADLSKGLQLDVPAGLIYAGRAGGTPESLNTLRGRMSMHLYGNYKSSTLRWSLGSVLAHANCLAAIDESQLTEWMRAHLRVVAMPVSDARAIGELETETLAALDPPMNLSKVGKTPLRGCLSALRKKYNH